MQFRRINVEYEGTITGDIRIIAVNDGLEHIPVQDMIDRWIEGGRPGRPLMIYFKICTTDGKDLIIRYHSLFDAWARLIGDT